MQTASDSFLRDQLAERRQKLVAAAQSPGSDEQVLGLLEEVDAALERMRLGTFGLCEACHDPIEQGRLMSDPLIRFCIDHLTAVEQESLQRDLELAAQIQRSLLPPTKFLTDDWAAAFHYEAVGPVSGDYCDLISSEDGNLWLLFGDVSGKGIAAAMLMAQLHAIFRTLTTQGLPVTELLGKANALFCGSTLADCFATLVCVRVMPEGTLQICNAGHCPPFLLRSGKLLRVEATGLPVGITCQAHYESSTLRLNEGESALFYTDGLTEASNFGDEEYGEERLQKVLSGQTQCEPSELIHACLRDVHTFLGARKMSDDVALLVLQKRGKLH